jgi:hypothetical protein
LDFNLLAPPLFEAIISAAFSTAWLLPLLLVPDHNEAVAAAVSTKVIFVIYVHVLAI